MDIYSGLIHAKWLFSIVMLVYQRVIHKCRYPFEAWISLTLPLSSLSSLVSYAHHIETYWIHKDERYQIQVQHLPREVAAADGRCSHVRTLSYTILEM